MLKFFWDFIRQCQESSFQYPLISNEVFSELMFCLHVLNSLQHEYLTLQKYQRINESLKVCWRVLCRRISYDQVLY